MQCNIFRVSYIILSLAISAVAFRRGTFDFFFKDAHAQQQKWHFRLVFFKDAHAKQKKQLSPKNLMESKMGDKALTYLSLRKMV